MTVSTTIASQTFHGNDVTTVFSCAFRILKAEDIAVYKVEPDTAIATPLVLNTDYAVTGAGDANGFTVTTTAAVASGKNLLVKRNLAYQQPTDFRNQGAFFPTMHEDMADRLSMQIQQVSETAGRALKVPEGLALDGDPTLPAPLAGATPVWDADLKKLVNVPPYPIGATTADLIKYTPPGTGAVARTAQAKLQETVTPEDYGAVGDGTTDDTAAFVEADALAASYGRPLYIPKPTVAYFGSGFRPTTDWLCEPGTTFLNSNRGATGGSAYLFFVIEHDVVVENAICDANRINGVTGTPDIPPGGWTSANYDAFTGGIAILIQDASPRIINCQGRNSGGNPVWFIQNSGAKLTRCRASGGRGNFGDGFYLSGCVNPVLEDCVADDVTRIGFVSEAKSAGVKLVRPIATNAHDGGIAYGGTEFNASIWYENTIGSSVQDPDCDNDIVVGVAGQWAGDVRAKEPITIRGGRSANMTVSSAPSDLFDIFVSDHRSGQCTSKIVGNQTASFSRVRLLGGGAHPTKGLNGTFVLDGSIGANTSVILRDSTLQVLGDMDTPAHGHIALQQRSPKFIVDNVNGLDKSGNSVPLLVGINSGSVTTQGSMLFRDSSVSLWGTVYCGGIVFDGSYTLTLDNIVSAQAPLYFGANGVITTTVVNNSNRLFAFNNITLKGTLNNVRLRMVGDASLSIADFGSARFEFDMSILNGVMEFSEPNWRYVNLNGTTFRNTAGTSLAGNYWIKTATTPPVTLSGYVTCSSTVQYDRLRNTTPELISGFSHLSV